MPPGWAYLRILLATHPDREEVAEATPLAALKAPPPIVLVTWCFSLKLRKDCIVPAAVSEFITFPSDPFTRALILCSSANSFVATCSMEPDVADFACHFASFVLPSCGVGSGTCHGHSRQGSVEHQESRAAGDSCSGCSLLP